MVTENFSAYSLEDFYHPTLFVIYKVFWETSLLIITVFFLFMLYVILKNSKEIGTYKYFIVNQLIWTYLFDLVMGMWKPVVLWPVYLGFGVGWFRSWRGIWAFSPLFILGIVGVGMGVSIFMSLFHRYIYIFPSSDFAKRYEYFSFKVFFYGTIFIIIECTILIPISVFYVDPEILRESITSKYPVMGFFFDNEPSIFGYDPALNNQLSVVYMFITVIFFFGIVLLAIVLYFNFMWLMKRKRHTVSITTYKTQITLFKIIYFQLLAVLGLLVVPYLLCVFFTTLGIR